jgi:hypothetical protein
MQELRIAEYLSAAALLAAGVKLLRVEGPSGVRGKCHMVFDNSGGISEQRLKEHLAGTLQVSSARMADGVQALKTRLFSARRGD